jgi:hypothetical protein
MVAKGAMPLVLALEVASVVGLQRELDVFVPRAFDAPLRVLPRIGTDEARVRISGEKLLLGARQPKPSEKTLRLYRMRLLLSCRRERGVGDPGASTVDAHE